MLSVSISPPKLVNNKKNRTAVISSIIPILIKILKTKVPKVTPRKAPIKMKYPILRSNSFLYQEFNVPETDDAKILLEPFAIA